MTLPGDPYRELGLTPGASANEIRSAYRRLAKRFHPDAAGERALPRFLAIQAAYERLVDSDGELRPPSATRGRPAPAWSADPDRARATRESYRARRAGWSSDRTRDRAGSATGTSDAAGPEAGTGPEPAGGAGAAGRTRRPADDGAGRDRTAGTPGGGTSGRRGARSGGSSSRRSTRKATQGSTTYDEAADIPRDQPWQGAGWYGPASGTFWTINPHEYADPRKHGPEYQARARRAAEVEHGGRRPRTGGAPDSEPAGARPIGDAAGTEAQGADAGWQWAAGGARATGTPGTRTDAGAEDWSAERWTYQPEVDDMPDAAARAAWERATRARSTVSTEPLLDLEELIGRLSPANLRRYAARGDIRTRVALALVGWPPVGFGVATLIGELSGCASFSAGCIDAASWVSAAAQPAIVAILVLVPVLAAILAFATLGALAVTIPLGLMLGLATATDPDAGRGLLAIAAGATYLIALVGAVVWGRRRSTPTQEAGAS